MKRAGAGAALALLGALLAGCPRPTPRPETPPRFEEISARAGIRFTHQNGAATGQFRYIEVTPGGVALFDFDNDGWLDLFFVQSGPSEPPATVQDRPHCALYKNKGDGTFVEVTAGSGFDRDLGYAHGVAVGDIDNDGFDDLFLTSLAGNRLFRNERGSGKFADVTTAWGLDRRHSTGYATGAAFGDYDNDGRLDLFVCYYAPWTWRSDAPCSSPSGKRDYCNPQKYDLDSPQLLRNAGGKFVDVSASSGIARGKGRGLVCAFHDFDDDGRQDILVGNDFSGNFLWHNNGDSTFTDRALESGLAVRGDGLRMAAMGIAFGDFDRSGRESVYLTDFSGAANPFFQSRRGGLYEEISARTRTGPATSEFVSFGCEFFDFDADGWMDLANANGHVTLYAGETQEGESFRQRSQLFRNRGDGSFDEILGEAALGPLAAPAVSRGLATGDLDNDGRIDLVVVRQNDPALALRNRDASGNHWVSFRTVGTRSNRDGLHARLRLTAGGKMQAATVRAGSSYLSVSDRRVYFGLGGASTIETVEVHWPSGTKDVWKNVAADGFYTLTEGEGIAPTAIRGRTKR